LGNKQLAGLLEKEGFHVRVHDDHFDPDEEDEIWLASCGQRGWIAITPDKRILKDPLSMKAIGANRGRVFFLPHNNKNPQMWAPILVANWTKISRIIATKAPPFIAKVSPNGVYEVKALNRYGREKKKSIRRRA
jgi:PIN like domain